MKVKLLKKIILPAIGLSIAVTTLVYLFLVNKFADKIHYNFTTLPTKKAALVFGAGYYADGSLTPILKDRVLAGITLYKQKKVEVLLFSGDNSHKNYNEPEYMKKFAIKNGVPEEIIFLDYAGRRTYDTCYRAKEIFGLNDIILVTQEYHLPRALYTADFLGIESVGYAADSKENDYKNIRYYRLREFPAFLNAIIETCITKPKPILGKKEPIFSPKGEIINER